MTLFATEMPRLEKGSITLTQANAWMPYVHSPWRPGVGKDIHTTQLRLAKFIKFVGDLNVEEIGCGVMYTAQAHFSLQVKSGTVNRILAPSLTILNKLKKHELLIRDVPTIDRKQEPKGRERTYSPTQIADLLEGMGSVPNGPTARSFMEFVCCTGCRQGEALKLRWDTGVNFDANRITFLDVKERGDRSIPMSPRLRQLMERLHAERVDDAEVFDISAKNLRKALKRAKQIVGIDDPTLLWHSLRHYVITDLWDKGHNLPTIQVIVGHKLMKTTQRYTKTRDQRIEDALASL